jgi:two-component system phosphate regulon response regulator OmpR
MSSILLVDDDPDILQVLGTCFESAGHEIVTTTDPLSVDDLFSRRSFDAMILDVMMPVRTGWEVLERVRRSPATQNVPVILLSAIGDPANRVRGIRLGADDFLAKPFDPEEVLVRVEGLLARRTPGEGSFQGSLTRVSLGEVLQTLQQSHSNGSLEVITLTGRGEIALEEGLVVGAVLGRFTGVDAVLSLLGQKNGSFRMRDDGGSAPLLPRPLNVQGLLLESAWISDELERRAAFRGDELQPLRVARPDAVVPPPGLPTMPADWVRATVAARPGITLRQILDEAPSAAPRVHLAVAWLLEQGVLEGVAPATERPPAEGEELDDLLDELTRECRQRGFREPASLAVLIHPRAWSSFPPWLVALARRNASGARAVSVRMAAADGRSPVEIVFRSLAGNTDDTSLADFLGLIVWLGSEDVASVIPALETANRHFRPRALRLAVSSTGKADLPGSLATAHWRSTKEMPDSFTHLLEMLLSPFV